MELERILRNRYYRDVGKPYFYSVKAGGLLAAGGAISFWWSDCKVMSLVVACCGIGIYVASRQYIEKIASKRAKVDKQLFLKKRYLKKLTQSVQPLTGTVLIDRPIERERTIDWDTTIKLLEDIQENMENQLSQVCFWNEVENYSATYSFSTLKQHLNQMDLQLSAKLEESLRDSMLQIEATDINIQDTDLLGRILTNIEVYSVESVEGMKKLLEGPGEDELDKSKKEYALNNVIRRDERQESDIGIVERPSGSAIHPDSTGHERDAYHREREIINIGERDTPDLRDRDQEPSFQDDSPYKHRQCQERISKSKSRKSKSSSKKSETIPDTDPQGADPQGPQDAGAQGPQDAGAQGPQDAGAQGPQDAGAQKS